MIKLLSLKLYNCSQSQPFLVTLLSDSPSFPHSAKGRAKKCAGDKRILTNVLQIVVSVNKKTIFIDFIILS